MTSSLRMIDVRDPAHHQEATVCARGAAPSRRKREWNTFASTSRKLRKNHGRVQDTICCAARKGVVDTSREPSGRVTLASRNSMEQWSSSTKIVRSSSSTHAELLPAQTRSTTIHESEVLPAAKNVLSAPDPRAVDCRDVDGSRFRRPQSDQTFSCSRFDGYGVSLQMQVRCEKKGSGKVASTRRGFEASRCFAPSSLRETTKRIPEDLRRGIYFVPAFELHAAAA
ncbi:hypothetical protein EK21DRAFT_89789 [Setomelanomma holmii]|uniref:Uncharacterized protein n=1 Tax=Setomelanomma holmii TaxID=210430 RepID=A0A9P4LM71_9PLEO|nr:hypothetical protein EK21DRAFT_89789 [Setomelanomma holmii]